MKILYCNKYNFPFSGTEVYLFEAMELMRSRGHEVALFSMSDERGEPTAYDEHFVKRMDFKGRSGFWNGARQAMHAIYSIEARKKLRGMIAKFRPDVAHVRNIYHHLSPSILWELKAQSVPVLYHLNDFKMLCPSYNMVSHGMPCEKCHRGKFWNVVAEGCYSGPAGSSWILAAEAYFHKWLRTYKKCVDRFLAPSQFVKDKLTESGWDKNKIDVLQHFQRIPKEASPNLSSGTPVVYFGRLSSEKGLIDLLMAMARLPEIPLVIAGTGPQQIELEALACELKLRKVTFVGHLDRAELDTLIVASRFTVMPSRAYETMGKSILESYACGRAVVASDIGSRRELILEGETGLLFRPRDSEHLAEVISQLYHAPNVAAKMGSSALDFVRKKHSEESHYQQLIKIYAALAEKSQRARPSRQPLKVAFIGGRGVISKYSGIETYYEEAGRQLANMGHDITVYCRSNFTPDVKTFNGMRVIRLPTISTKHLETGVHTLLSTLHAVFSGCDIVHYQALGPAIFSFLPRCAGKKTVVTIQGLDWQRKKWGWAASQILHLGERAALTFPNATIVVSQTLRNRYRDLYKIETNYVPNGTSLRSRGTLKHLKSWGLESQKYILFMGRLSPEKNCHVLIDAYERLRPAMKLVLAGGASYSDSYAASLRTHCNDQIQILDWVEGEKLGELLTNAALFVLASDLEGLSLALLDAMGAGVCVLASDIPENREIVDRVGFTFKPRNIFDLQRMLQLLIGDAELRENTAARAREHVSNQYLWPDIARRVEEVYLKMMGRCAMERSFVYNEGKLPAPEGKLEDDNRVA